MLLHYSISFHYILAWYIPITSCYLFCINY